MYIALIADDHKKELMAQFCIAYSGILGRHNLCATHTTGSYISEVTGLDIETFLPGSFGGAEQIASRVAYDEIDLVFYFRDNSSAEERYDPALDLTRLCDANNIPLATNIATAEVLVTALDAGNFNYREFVNPRSEYNLRKKNATV
jgi:methylglyoxal synthase